MFGRKRDKYRVPIHPGLSASISSEHLKKVVADFEASGREYCLDVGSTEWLDDKYESVNFKPFDGLTYFGDIRTLFAPSYMDEVDKYPDLAKISQGKYKLVRAVDIVEHIEWIHQEFLFRWLYSLLADGGLLFVETPNLDYFVHLYLRAMKKLSAGKNLDGFPFDEHPYTQQGEPQDIIRLINSVLFAGCSSEPIEGERRGDFHHCCYNKLWLETVLGQADPAGGFTNIRIHEDQRLKVIAQKPFSTQLDVSVLIKRELP